MNQQGVALLLILWVITLLTALISTFVLVARIEAMQNRVVHDNAQLQEIARAGIEYALARATDINASTHWMPDGRLYEWQFDRARLQITIIDESGKVDLNDAQADLLSALFRALGAERQEADQLAAAIVDWRDPDSLTQPAGGAENPEYAAAGLPYGAKDAPFDSVAELLQVLGMTPEWYRRVQPYVTLHAGRSQPDPRYAPAPVLTALGLDAAAIIAERNRPSVVTSTWADIGSGTYSIESQAQFDNGRQSRIRVVVNNRPRIPMPGLAYEILRWEEIMAD